MNELGEALRAEGHTEIADALERKSLAGQLRKAGRDDLAESLEAGDQTPPVEEAPSPAALQPHELLAKQLHDAQTKWHTLGGPSGDPAA